MPPVTATQVITDAFGDLNVIQNGETIAPADSTDVLRRLNLMIGQLATQSLTIPAVSQFVFPIQANKGTPTNPYTVGIGGDLNIPRPTFQQSVVGAGLVLNASNPAVEIPRGMMTSDAWQFQRIKNLPSVLFTDVYYRPDYLGDLGSLFLWPIPTDTTNSLVLYIEQAIATFPDLTTVLSVPPGYDDMLHWNLAEELIVPYGRVGTPIQATIEKWATRTLANVKRSNFKLTDVPNDMAAIGSRSRRGWYNLQTGEPSA